MDSPLKSKPEQLHYFLAEMAKSVLSNHAFQLFSVYFNIRIKIGNRYEGLCIRHFLKEDFIFSLEIGCIDLYQGQRFSLL
ncbi:unnamed protein product [Soboliphyme baturini]|uniref:Uncharacterized protein n=1 Tax=Soboliphyme baturini TaxID=241478 RepID=A0A183IRM2_9BILA|nr:unnamed protein product [Soboliphyme baturini]